MQEDGVSVLVRHALVVCVFVCKGACIEEMVCWWGCGCGMTGLWEAVGVPVLWSFASSVAGGMQRSHHTAQRSMWSFGDANCMECVSCV